MLFRLPDMAGKRALIRVKQFHADDGGNFKCCTDPAFRITFLNALQQPPGNTGPVRDCLGGESALLACGANQFAK